MSLESRNSVLGLILHYLHYDGIEYMLSKSMIIHFADLRVRHYAREKELAATNLPAITESTKSSN